MFEGISKFERPAQIIFGIWTEIVHNLKGSLDNIKGNMQQQSSKDWIFMPYGTEAYFIDGFLIRWNGSTLHQSIYLNRCLEFRKGVHYKKVHFVCIAIGRFLIVM